MTESKERLDKLAEKYSSKIMELKREKADNDAWRVRARE